jgi:hypothetical protein
MRAALDRAAGRVTRGMLAAFLVVLVTIAGLAVVVAVFGRGWWRDDGGAYAPRTLVAKTHVTPSSSLFGDPLTASVDVLVDGRTIDPATVDLEPDFKPFVIRSQTSRILPHVGRAKLVRLTYTIQCVTAACVQLVEPPKSSKDTEAVRFGPAQLSALTRDGAVTKRTITWPPFVVHSRLSATEIALSSPKVDAVFTPPAVSWRVTPNLVGALALSAGVVLLLGAGLLVATLALGDDRRFRLLRIPSHLSPVERALRLAEHAAARGEADEERKALERLAVELRRSGAPELAGRAGQLAWSEGEPSLETVGELAQAVRSNGGG